MKNLILSWNVYDWLYNFYDILNKEEYYDLIIICEYGNVPSKNYPNLCQKAIKAQRTHDLLRLSKQFNIDKIINLDYYPLSNNLEKIKTQLLLNCFINKYSVIYYTYSDSLFNILKKLKNTKLSCSENKYNIPIELKSLIIGE